MTRRTTFFSLLLAAFLLFPSPAVAKGPTQVEVQNLGTGTSTMLTWEQPELMALMELVEWPADRRPPQRIADGGLPHVATLAWQLEGGQSAWLDRVYSNGKGTTWIARRDHLSGSTFVAWGRVRAPFALQQLIAGLEGAKADPDNAAAETPAADSPAVQTTEPRAVESRFDTASFAWGAAAAALLAGALNLVLRRRLTARA